MVPHTMPVPGIDDGGLIGVPNADEDGENDPGIPMTDEGGANEMVGEGTAISGLIPALPSSTEPNGIPDPVVPAVDKDEIPGDDAAALLEPLPQVTNVAVLPGTDAPVPNPNPPPSYVPRPDMPGDAPPVVGHVVPKPIVPVPLMIGLSPGDASSVAPKGIPAGETDDPGVMPSGEVAAIPGVGMLVPPTCAAAGMQPKSTAGIAAINVRRIVISIFLTQRSAQANRSSRRHCHSRSLGAGSILPALFPAC